MTLQVTEKERHALIWLLQKALPSLAGEAARQDDAHSRRFFAERHEELASVAELLRVALLRDAA